MRTVSVFLLLIGVVYFKPASAQAEEGMQWGNPLTYVAYPAMMIGGIYLTTIWHEGGHYIAHKATGGTNTNFKVGPSPFDGSVKSSDNPSGFRGFIRNFAGPASNPIGWELTDWALDRAQVDTSYWARFGGWWYLTHRLLVFAQIMMGWQDDGDFYSAHITAAGWSRGTHTALMGVYTGLFIGEFLLNFGDIQQNWNRFVGKKTSDSNDSAWKFFFLGNGLAAQFRF